MALFGNGKLLSKLTLPLGSALGLGLVAQWAAQRRNGGKCLRTHFNLIWEEKFQ